MARTLFLAKFSVLVLSVLVVGAVQVQASSMYALTATNIWFPQWSFEITYTDTFNVGHFVSGDPFTWTGMTIDANTWANGYNNGYNFNLPSSGSVSFGRIDSVPFFTPFYGDGGGFWGFTSATSDYWVLDSPLNYRYEQVATTTEPSAFVLLASGLALAAFARMRFKRR